MNEAGRCILPTIEYFDGRLGEGGPLFGAVEAFCAVRLCNPSKANDKQPVVADADQLRAFPFISGDEMDGMKAELPAYVAASEYTHEAMDVIQWWSQRRTLLNWRGVLQKILLVQPSSTAAERVVSLLENSFSQRHQ